MTLDFNTICRVCLETKPTSYDLFTSYDGKRNILYCQMLDICTELNLYKGDGLPSLICKSCCQELKRAYKFNVQCMDSDHKLCSIIEAKVDHNQQIKIESTEESNTDTHDVDVKHEPSYLDDSWQADDDNIILAELKIKNSDNCLEGLWGSEIENKSLEVTSIIENNVIQGSEANIEKDVIELENNLIKEKRKRGRPKKDEGGYQCDICGKVISNSCNLKQHKLCHTDIRPYTCTDCPATFRGYSALFQHKKIHTGETPYHCQYCPKQFGRRTGLVNHIRTHTGEKKYVCGVCSKSFSQNTQLSTHMKRHKGDKSFLCQVCGKGFPVKADLRVHERIHNGEKPYACHLCPKRFATAGNLSIHVRIHKKDVRYHCKQCQRGFVTCSAYNIHVKRHLGQKDYVCDCGKAFYTSSGLKQHKVVHTGERRYQCSVCERKFSQSSHLKRHNKKEHVKPSEAQAYQELLNSNDIKCEGK